MKFIHLLSACPPGWRIDPADTIKIMRLATQTHVFPIYEVHKRQTLSEKGEPVEDWQYTLTVVPEKTAPLASYFKAQGRFNLMTDAMIEASRKRIEKKWIELVEKAGQGRAM
jgi:pyruvate/2-oxoacid:ferredoxin oxidoreductase beta subunit